MDIPLNEQDRPFGVHTACKEHGCGFPDLPSERGGVLSDSEGMKVHYTVNAVVIILKGAPVADRSEIVSQCETTGGLNAAKHGFFRFFCHIERPPFNHNRCTVSLYSHRKNVSIDKAT